MIVFTYRSAASNPTVRWSDSGVPDTFFDTLEEARSAVLEMRAEIRSASVLDWSPVHIERVEITPIVGRDFLTLLKKGIGPFVRACEIVETVD